MSSKKRECIPEVHPFLRISIEKASLETLLDAAVYLVEDIPVKCGSGAEVVFKMKSGKFVTLQLREDGAAFMSEEY